MDGWVARSSCWRLERARPAESGRLAPASGPALGLLRASPAAAVCAAAVAWHSLGCGSAAMCDAASGRAGGLRKASRPRLGEGANSALCNTRQPLWFRCAVGRGCLSVQDRWRGPCRSRGERAHAGVPARQRRQRQALRLEAGRDAIPCFPALPLTVRLFGGRSPLGLQEALGPCAPTKCSGATSEQRAIHAVNSAISHPGGAAVTPGGALCPRGCLQPPGRLQPSCRRCACKY